MSTVITRIMHKLRMGNDSERITVHETGVNVSECNESDESHGNTSMLIRSLENDEVELVASPGIIKQGAKSPAEKVEVMHADYRIDAAGEPIHTELNPILTEEQQKAITDKAADNRMINKFGKKVDDEGGFNPYG